MPLEGSPGSYNAILPTLAASRYIAAFVHSFLLCPAFQKRCMRAVFVHFILREDCYLACLLASTLDGNSALHLSL